MRDPILMALTNCGFQRKAELGEGVHVGSIPKVDQAVRELVGMGFEMKQTGSRITCRSKSHYVSFSIQRSRVFVCISRLKRKVNFYE